MRVLQINVVYGYGSTGIIVRDLQNQCVKNGIECETVCLFTNADIPTVHRFGNKYTGKVHALLTRLYGKQGYYSTFETKQLLKYMDTYKPDIVHLHNLHGNYVNLPMLFDYLAKKDITVAATHHDCWLFTGGCTHYTRSNCFKWLEHCGDCPQRKEEFSAWLKDCSTDILTDKNRMFGKIKKLVSIGVSQWVVDESKKSAFRDARCVAIHSGIDTEFFKPTPSDIRKRFGIEDKFLILAPSNKWFLEQNRETFNYFAERLDDDIAMLFFGTGIDESRLTDKMNNVGFISSREQIREVFSSVDVMVNCTREETLSLLNLEVQACGTPVITYSNTGVKETVDGKCGFAVENGNPAAAWDAVLAIKKNGKQHYTEACQKWVEQEFDRDKNYQKYIDLYKTLI